MKAFSKVLVLFAFLAMPALAEDGLVRVASDFDVPTTADRLESVLQNKGMRIFNRVPHSGAAADVGVALRPTELLIFGNPKVGSPLMKCAQRLAIDLPQKALIWEDESGHVWIGYNAPAYLQKRHAVSGCDAVFAKVSQALAGMTRAAAKQSP